MMGSNNKGIDKSGDSLTYEERCLLYILKDRYAFAQQIVSVARTIDNILNEYILGGTKEGEIKEGLWKDKANIYERITDNGKLIYSTLREVTRRTPYSVLVISSLKLKGYIKSNYLITLDPIYSLTDKGKTYIQNNIHRDLDDIFILNFMLEEPLPWDINSQYLPRSIEIILSAGIISIADLKYNIDSLFIKPNSLYGAFNIDIDKRSISFTDSHILRLDDTLNVLAGVEEALDAILGYMRYSKHSKTTSSFIEDVFVPYCLNIRSNKDINKDINKDTYKIPLLISKKKLINIRQEYGEDFFNYLLIEEYLFTYTNLRTKTSECFYKGPLSNKKVKFNLFLTIYYRFLWSKSINRKYLTFKRQRQGS